MPDTIDKMPDSGNGVPDRTETVPDTMEKMPDSEQEQQIYKYVLENGSITTAETVEILDVKHRRARAVLLNMVKDGYLRKEGAARSNCVHEQVAKRIANVHCYDVYECKWISNPESHL